MPRQRPVSRTVHQKRVLCMVRHGAVAKTVPHTFYIPRGIRDEKIDDYITRNLLSDGDRVAYHKAIELVNVTYTMAVSDFLAHAEITRTEADNTTKGE